jgi:hypothetical protein
MARATATVFMSIEYAMNILLVAYSFQPEHDCDEQFQKGGEGVANDRRPDECGGTFSRIRVSTGYRQPAVSQFQ